MQVERKKSMVALSRYLRLVSLLAIISLCFTNTCAFSQNVSYQSSSANINVWLNSELTEYNTELSYAMSNDSAIFKLGKDHGYYCQSGQPKIPSQVLRLLLPSNAPMTGINTSLEAQYADVDGVWDVVPMPPAAIMQQDGSSEIIWPESATIVDGYDADIYGENALWPPIEAKRLSLGYLRSYKILELTVPLYRYNPATGTLQSLSQADVVVTTSKKTIDQSKSSNITGIASVNERVSELALNYSQVSDSYPESYATKAPNLNDTGYVIITTNAIANASNKLADFVAHKSKWFTVNVITETQYGAASGDAAATNIRNWLRNNYQNEAYGSGGILYVLLIGDPRVNSSSVPMKLCKESPDHGDLPTDYYYAELTGNWDANGNGIYGESDDNPENKFEVYTGRVPYYGSISTTDHILQKFIDYDNATDTAWRRSALLPMVPLDDVTPAYQTGEQIKYDSLEPRFIKSTRMYEHKYGLTPPPEYTFSERYPANEWGSGQYGMMIWQTHGWSQGGAGVISSGETGRLNDNYPSAVFQGSCMTGDPDATDNLGFYILSNGGIGTIAASRNGLYWVGQTNFTNTTSVGGIGYQYAKRIAERKSLGRAIYESKESLGFWLQNYYVYNLYGDPSTVVMPAEPDFGVGPTHSLYYSLVYGSTSTDSESLTLKNNSNSSISWTATKGTANWYDLSASSGTISRSGTATVNVVLNSNTQYVPVGTHTDTIVLRNETSGQEETRTVTLIVNPMRKIAHWPMNETSGETLTDISGNDYNGTLANTDFSTASIAGKYSNGMLFDGSDDYVSVPDIVEDMSGITISVWMKPDDWNGNRRIMQKGGDGSEYRLLIENSKMVFEIGNTRLEISEKPAVGAWTHVAAVYDNTTMQIYYNKVLKGSKTRSGTVPSSSSTLYIGSKNSSSIASDLFKGVMDELQIFNYAKDAAGIADLYDGKNMAEVIYPYHGSAEVMLITGLEWMMGLTAVNNDVYLGTNYDSVFNATVTSSEYKGRQTESSLSPGTLIRNTDYYWRVDQVDASGVVTKGTVWKFSTGNGTGGITWEVWYNISGNNVTSLTGNANYPDNPDNVEILPSLEGPRDHAENYGSRLHGFLVPPATGDYKFWIASDDYSELWLSPDLNPENAVRVSYVHGVTGYQEWTKYASQESASIALQAGVPYYIMAIHKEGAVGDYVSVGFTGPETSNITIVPGECLMPYADDYSWGPTFSSKVIVGPTAFEGQQYAPGSLAGEVMTVTGEPVSFSKIAGPGWLLVEEDGSCHGIAWDHHVGTNRFEVMATDSNGLTASALFEIYVADVFTGENNLSDFAMISQNWLEQASSNGADLNHDNNVNISDIEVFMQNWLYEIIYEEQPCYWPFDTNGDEAINGYHGSLNGDAILVSDGLIEELGGGALSLNGESGCVEVNGYTGVNGKSSRTCMAWVKTDASQLNTIVSWGQNAASSKWVFYVSDDGSLAVSVWGGQIYSYDKVSDGNWHHAAAVLPGVENPVVSDIVLYIDGKAVETYYDSDIAIDTVSGSNISIGSISDTTMGYFGGLLDEVRIYDIALTSVDIARISGADLKLHLALDESEGNVANDTSVNGNDGTLNNGPVWNLAGGMVGGSLLFDGADDSIGITGYAGISGKNSRTCMAWIKTEADQLSAITSWGSNENGKKWIFYVNDDGSLAVSVWGGQMYSNALINDGQWHHVAAVLCDDGTPDISEVVLYIDGQAVETYYDNVMPIETGVDSDMTIGVINSLSMGYFNGQIDDVRIYENALAQDEIEAIIQ